MLTLRIQLRSNQVCNRCLQPVLDRIATAAQEISSLAVLDGDEVVFIARGSLDAGILRRPRYRLSPAWPSAPRSGRVILGQLSDAELTSRLKAMRREPMTAHTEIDPKRLFATIIADREQGLIRWSTREAEPHSVRASVPIRRYDGAIIAAINMGAHVDRISTA